MQPPLLRTCDTKIEYGESKRTVGIFSIAIHPYGQDGVVTSRFQPDIVNVYSSFTTSFQVHLIQSGHVTSRTHCEAVAAEISHRNRYRLNERLVTASVLRVAAAMQSSVPKVSSPSSAAGISTPSLSILSIPTYKLIDRHLCSSCLNQLYPSPCWH